MNSYQKLSLGILAGVLTLVFYLPVRAQNNMAQGELPLVDMQTAAPAPKAAPPPMPAPQDHDWHLDLSPYLWLAGEHGIVGVRGHSVSIHASPGDLLSHLDFGLMGAAEARYKQYLLTGDLLWLRLSDDRGLPLTDPAAVSVDVRVGELVWTSKVGYRLIDSERFKADANVGLRFWHLGQKLNLNPNPLGGSITGSVNWADFVLGGRLRLPVGMSEKAMVDLLGDVGGWGGSAKLDYQIAALAGYKISSRWTLLAGYRYLFVDYRNRSGVINTVSSGALLGATYKWK